MTEYSILTAPVMAWSWKSEVQESASQRIGTYLVLPLGPTLVAEAVTLPIYASHEPNELQAKGYMRRMVQAPFNSLATQTDAFVKHRHLISRHLTPSCQLTDPAYFDLRRERWLVEPRGHPFPCQVSLALIPPT